ncbi:Tubulin tyrosine ligase protein 12 [Fasciola gigantica]|uniref:Tubulin tyrosine ligase protein 12 n=1 Tax=Fasciola gigantica TaxID=46835 RepID=A0A504YU88_FASGI|nr:Tubulin tyrosine ligase protein 12 [Fasciola gigantica]
MLHRVEYLDNNDNVNNSLDRFDWQVTVCSEELSYSHPDCIFLVDHAWTFEPGSIRESLKKVPGLKDRMASLMDIQVTDPNELIDVICKDCWRFCRHYKLSQSDHAEMLHQNPELQHLRWYVLDELGSRIGHSDEPTARMVPFFYMSRGICYSVFWPLKDLHRDDVITVDYIEHIKNASLRPYYLLPWQPEDHSEEPVDHTYTLTDDFFVAHRIQESLPDPNCSVAQFAGDEKITVYTDLPLIRSYLTDPRFILTHKMDEAQVLWLLDHFKDFAKLSVTSPNKFINQFPGEQVVTVKDLLASLASVRAKQAHSSLPNAINTTTADLDQFLTTAWYPVTFNLVYELPQFVAYFQKRQNEIDEFVTNDCAGRDTVRCSDACPRCAFHRTYGKGDSAQSFSTTKNNIWILKPWNSGRGLGITITDSLDHIIRLCDTNFLIASRYVTDPVLFYRDEIHANVKFDLRYVVLLHSVHPLKLAVYNVFWLRFANKSFDLENFTDYGKHFTVMNYREDEQLKQIHFDEFVRSFEQQYPGVVWDSVQADIFNVLIEIFTVACAHPTPKGISVSNQSRALYAVDLMLEWRSVHVSPATTLNGRHHRISPVVCEVNYMPDCVRACKYHPEFFNHVFSYLFLNDSPEICNMTELM